MGLERILVNCPFLVVEEVVLGPPAVTLHGHEQIRPAVVVVIAPHRAVTILVISWNTQDAVRDQSKGAVSLV
jgi:hypothetical protein